MFYYITNKLTTIKYLFLPYDFLPPCPRLLMSCVHDSHEHVRQTCGGLKQPLSLLITKTWKQVMHCIFYSLATQTYLPLYLNYIPCLGVCSLPCSDEVLWPCVCPSELCETGKIIVINIRSKHFYNFQYAVAD